MECNIVDTLVAQYETFTAAEKKIADYVLTHQRESLGLGITELSAECSVAVSTVSVFCRKLKLAGFNDFKIELARANTVRPNQGYDLESTVLQPGDSADQVLEKTYHWQQETLRRSANMLSAKAVDRAVEMMGRAGQVLFLGQGNHAAIAQMAWAQFSVTSSKFKTVQDAHLQTIALSTLSENDVVVYFSYSGATLEIMDAVEIIREVGAKLVLVTRFIHSPAAEFADAVLISGADENPLQFGSADALIAQIYVLDVLLGCYCLHYGENLEHNREFIGKGLAKKQL